MLRLALLFLIVALVAALLGFTTIAGAAVMIAKSLFYIFMILFIAFLLIGLLTGMP